MIDVGEWTPGGLRVARRCRGRGMAGGCQQPSRAIGETQKKTTPVDVATFQVLPRCCITKEGEKQLIPVSITLPVRGTRLVHRVQVGVVNGPYGRFIKTFGMFAQNREDGADKHTVNRRCAEMLTTFHKTSASCCAPPRVRRKPYPRRHKAANERTDARH